MKRLKFKLKMMNSKTSHPQMMGWEKWLMAKQ